ncbi:cell division protein ZapA [Porticoccaceae bacterium LTM1]|nr:cell division protein ZapA [Porticoccaceae bacterium LTM1]
MTSPNSTNIRILDKEYQVNCSPEERPALLQSAQSLDQRMRNIKTNGSVLGIERIAVMAALNLTYDLMKLEQQPGTSADMEARLLKLDNTLDEALHKFENESLF